jgi:hypothetical protein
MAWYERIAKGAGGIFDVLEAPVQFGWDVAKAGFEDDGDGFWNTVWGSFTDRSAQMIGGAVGPNGFGGQLFGAIPGQVRKPLATVIGTGVSVDNPGFGMEEAFGGGLLGLAEGIGREFIREPLATGVTASSLALSDSFTGSDGGFLGLGGFSQLMKGNTWSRAHEIAQTRSLGQSVALAIMTKDILDEDELIKAQGSPWFQVISGGFDAAARIWLDTDTVLGGFGLEAFKVSKVAENTRGLATAQRLVGGGADYRVYQATKDAARAERQLTRLSKARDRALGVGDYSLEGKAERAAANLEGRVLDVAATTPLEERLLGTTRTFDEDAFTTSFKAEKGRAPTKGRIDAERRKFDELAAQSDDIGQRLGPDPLTDGVAAVDAKRLADGSRARRIVFAATDLKRAEKLDLAVDAAAAGNTTALYKWADKVGIKLSGNTVADLANPATYADAYEKIALQLADTAGFNTVKILDDAGKVDVLDLGNLDRTLGKSIDATTRAKSVLTRRAKYAPDLYDDVLRDSQYLKAQFTAFRKGGWDEALKAANGRVDTMSKNLKFARDQFIRSPHWNERALPWLASLDNLPLGQRTEAIRNRLFHNTADGDNVASWFALARDDATRTSLMKFIMGDHRTMQLLRETDPAMARDIELVAKRRFVARHYADSDVFRNALEEWELFNDPDQWAQNPAFNQMVDSWDDSRTVADVLEDIDYFTRGARPVYAGAGGRSLSKAQEKVLNAIRRGDDGLTREELMDALSLGSSDSRIAGSEVADADWFDELDELDDSGGFGPEGVHAYETDSVGGWFSPDGTYHPKDLGANEERWGTDLHHREWAKNRDADAISSRIEREINHRGAEWRLDRQQLDEVRAFMKDVGEELFDDVGLSIRKGDGSLYGTFNFSSDVATIYGQAFHEGRFTRTMFHELGHHLSRYIPTAQVVEGIDKPLAKARAKFLAKEPIIAAIVGDAGDWLKHRLTNDQVDQLVDQFGAAEVLHHVERVADGYKLALHDNDYYRLFSRDEWFAENLSDIAQGRYSDTGLMKTTFWQATKQLFTRMWIGTKRAFGADKAGAMYDELLSGGMRGDMDFAPRYQRAGTMEFEKWEQDFRKNGMRGDSFSEVAESRGGWRPGKTIKSLMDRGLIEAGPDGKFRAAMTTVDEVTDADLELQRLMQIAGQQKHFMRITGRGALRGSSLIQKVWENDRNKLRVVFDMVAHPFIEPNDPDVVGKVKRHLRDAGFGIDYTVPGGVVDNSLEEWLGEFAHVRWNDDAREQFLFRLRDQGFANLAMKHGVDQSVVDKIAQQVADAQSATSKFLQKAARFGGTDRATGIPFSRYTHVDPISGVTEHTFVPLTPEQLANAHVMPNFREIDRGLRRVAGWAKYGYQGKDVLLKVPTVLAESLQRIWKPAVLLRPAWPMRVVADEQIRMMSVMGVMERLLTAPASFRELKMNLIRDMFPRYDPTKNALFLGVNPETGLMQTSSEYSAMRLAKPLADPARAGKGGAIAGGLAGFALGGPVGAAAGAGLGAWRGYRGAQYANGLQALYLSSTRNLAYDGYKMLADTGNPGDIANLIQDQISAGRQLDSILSKDPAEEINRVRFDPRRFRDYGPSDAGYEEMWNTVVNHQFGNSKFSRMLWDDELSNDQLVDWLHTPEGRKVLNRMPLERRQNPEGWVAEARSYIDSNMVPLTPETRKLRKRMAEGGHISIREVKEAIGPDWQSVLGPIHGNEVMQITDRGGELMRFGRKKVENLMNHLGKTPTDTLSRQPFFRDQYQAEIGKQHARLRASGQRELTEKELRNLEDQARRTALHSTRTLLYDLAEESQLAQSVRFLMPFFNAWQEVLTRYAGIAVDNPLYASRAYKAYQGIEEVGEHIEDEFGNDYQRIRIPTWARGLINKGIFKSAVDDQGYFRFQKENLSMLGGGTPGFGPIVNISLGEVVKDRPELQESLGFMFPYGLTTGLSQLLPTGARRLLSVQQEDRSFQSTRARIAVNRLVALDEQGTPLDLTNDAAVRDFYAQVDREAKSLYHLRTVSALISPVAINFESPYQEYLDEWHRMTREDPTNAEQKFLTKYGEGYFALTQSLSKVYDGVPATVPGEVARKKYAALIEAHPEFGSLIIGDEGGGVGVQFSRAIYDKQFREAISTGNPQNRRESLPLDQIITKPDARIGWQKWRQFQDWKVDAMDRAGIGSLSEKGGEAIAAVQKAMIANLANQHPVWYTEFVDQDETKWLRRIKAFEAITETDIAGLRERDDVRGLREWLGIRGQIETVLAQREREGGSAYLTAKSNADLRFAWETMNTRLSEANPMFADLAARWLNVGSDDRVGDMIHPNSWRARIG